MYKIVVVEDEAIVRRGIIQSVDWSTIGCMVMGDAKDGESGIEIIRKVHPDIVISDISMPGISGIEMVQRLKDEGIEPKVIFLTAYDEFEYAHKAIQLKVCDYLLKPFKDGELENSVVNIIEELRPAGQSGTDSLENALTLQNGDKSKYLSDAIAFIDENFSNPEISVDMVAEHVGISSGHLSRLFRKETEYTMMTYLIDRRMRKAKELLKDYSHKIYEVAELVGYRDITFFSATFKKYVGVTPSDYQNRYRA